MSFIHYDFTLKQRFPNALCRGTLWSYRNIESHIYVLLPVFVPLEWLSCSCNRRFTAVTNFILAHCKAALSLSEHEGWERWRRFMSASEWKSRVEFIMCCAAVVLWWCARRSMSGSRVRVWCHGFQQADARREDRAELLILGGGLQPLIRAWSLLHGGGMERWCLLLGKSPPGASV